MSEYALVEPLDGQTKRWHYDSRPQEVTPDNWKTKIFPRGCAEQAQEFYTPRGDGKVPDVPCSVKVHPYAGPLSDVTTVPGFPHPDGTHFSDLAGLLKYTEEQAVLRANAGTHRGGDADEDPRRAAMLAEADRPPVTEPPRPVPTPDPETAARTEQALQTAGLRREAGAPPSRQPERQPEPAPKRR